MGEKYHASENTYWRCGKCGGRTPIHQAICQNPSCQADLSIYGTVVDAARNEEAEPPERGGGAPQAGG